MPSSVHSVKKTGSSTKIAAPALIISKVRMKAFYPS